jgi:hypothetical protein
VAATSSSPSTRWQRSRARWPCSRTSSTSRPWPRAASIRGCIQRGPGGGPTGFSPFLYLCCQGNSVNDSGLPARPLRRRPAPRRAAQGSPLLGHPRLRRCRSAAQVERELRAGDLAAPAARRDRQRQRRRRAQGVQERPRRPRARHAARLADGLWHGRVHRRPRRHQQRQPAAHLGPWRLRLPSRTSRAGASSTTSSSMRQV